MKYYCYNNLHNGDNIYGRTLSKELVRLGHEVIIGCYTNMLYMYCDFPNKISPFSEGNGDLLNHCPIGYTPIDTWPGRFWNGGFEGINWRNMITLFNGQSNDFKLEYDNQHIPYIDFDIDLVVNVPNESIYVANSQCRTTCSFFIFDIEILATTFPHYNFICTQKTGLQLPNVIDCSHMNLVELSKTSDSCIAIIGKGSGPYDCTFTSINKNKPKALCGFTNNKHTWDIDGATTEVFLYTMNEVIKFIKNI